MKSRPILKGARWNSRMTSRSAMNCSLLLIWPSRLIRATQQALRESGKPITAFELPSQSNEKEPGYFE